MTRSSTSVKGRPAANSAPVTSKKFADTPSMSTESDSLPSARAVMVRVAVTAGTSSCTPTSRTAVASRSIVAASEGLSGRRSASRSDTALYGIATAVEGEDVVGAEFAEQLRHAVAQPDEHRGDEHHGDDADDDAADGQPRTRRLRPQRVPGQARRLADGGAQPCGLAQVRRMDGHRLATHSSAR